MQLRYYQSAAIEATYEFLRSNTGDPLVVIPTGGGKTPVIATITSDAVNRWGGRVLILAHVKELLQQSADKLKAVDSKLDVGVYSAGLKRRDTDHPVIVAGIQSVYQRACELGRFDLILVDEAHLIPPEGDGMYRTFLEEARKVNPDVRLIGLTATPYRLSSGLIYGQGEIFSDVAYEIGVRELIVKGFLSPLKSKRGLECDTSGLHVRAGEFIESEVQDLAMSNVGPAVEELLVHTATSRRSVLVFAAGVKHAIEVANRINAAGFEVEIVTGDTSDDKRAEILERFKGAKICSECRQPQPCRRLGHVDIEPLPPLQYLVNVNVLTTGFDAPNVDCVALMRATASQGLLYQMVGRGFRLHPDKSDCLVLDFGGNIERHGPVDQLTGKPASAKREKAEAPGKTCPQCKAIIAAGYAKCPECDHEFEARQREKHEATASDASPVSDPAEVREEWYDVCGIAYAVHTKKGADESAPKTMRVDYDCGLRWAFSEWVCIEHAGFARSKAERWWHEMCPSEPFPASAAEAVLCAESGNLKLVRRIKVRHAGRFPEIGEWDLDDPPAVNRQPWETEPQAGLGEESWRKESIGWDDVPF